ncbi:hypothetical protein C6P40_000128 [Pichia californica]|uniref:Uncharacterized protein n=1 Tax=Pichia californica TaxID=460514 RepID=A0A9P7BFM5_9ASCO|nr:hypothetical protein C6P40_000128 [[Candida] californica]
MENNNLLVKRNDTAIGGPFSPDSKDKFRACLPVTNTELNHKRTRNTTTNRVFPLPSDIPTDAKTAKYLNNTTWTSRPLNAERQILNQEFTLESIPSSISWSLRI